MISKWMGGPSANIIRSKKLPQNRFTCASLSNIGFSRIRAQLSGLYSTIYNICVKIWRRRCDGSGMTCSRDFIRRGKYGTDKLWVHVDKRTAADIPLIHSTPIGGPRILWSDPVECKGIEDCVPMVGVPKVIFGESGINEVVIDLEGRYGMTQGAIGLRIPGGSLEDKKAEVEQMVKALESDIFHTILDAMSFSNFRIDWRMFLYLRPDFYKHPMFLGANKHVRPSITKTKTARAESTAAVAAAAAAAAGAGAGAGAATQRKNPKISRGGRSKKKRCKTKRRKRC